MSFINKVKEQLASRTAEACVIATTVLLAWAFSSVAPTLWRSISEEITAQAILRVLLLSLLINLILVTVLLLSLRASDHPTD